MVGEEARCYGVRKFRTASLFFTGPPPSPIIRCEGGFRASRLNTVNVRRSLCIGAFKMIAILLA